MSDAIEQGRALAEKQFEGGGFKGKKNAYECDGHHGKAGCGSYIVTVDVHPGVTPFMTVCGNCGGYAHSKFYRVSDSLVPTHQWYRPDSLEGIHQMNHDHISKGGLLLRPVAGGADKWLRGNR